MTASPLSTVPAAIWEEIRLFTETDHPKAIGRLLLLLAQMDRVDVSRIYASLLPLLPRCEGEQWILVQTHLQPLLEQSKQLFCEQRLLALALAKRALDFPRGSSDEELYSAGCEAMVYLAKAIQILERENPLDQKKLYREMHQAASQLFVEMAKRLQLNSFEKVLEEARLKGVSGLDRFGKLIRQIESLKKFCLSEKDYKELILPLYEQALIVLNRTATVGREVQRRYLEYFPIVTAGLHSPFMVPAKTVSERYREALVQFQVEFEKAPGLADSPETMMQFQAKIFSAFQTFFQLLLDEAMELVGPAPCHYDFRAMGSAARQELCPFSDLELLVLIENEEHKAYFRNVVKVLELQILSLGETATPTFVFSCIHAKNPSGLHLDESPAAEHSHFLNTPEGMAEMQGGAAPLRIQYTALKSRSLAKSSSELDENYVKTLEKVHPLSEREGQAQQLFIEELTDYLKSWKQPFAPTEGVVDLKRDYVKPLHFLLADMALFCGIEETNTLRLIDLLHELFSLESRVLLKEIVAGLYAIRIRIHQKYKEQNEEVKYGPFGILERDERLFLEKGYWLVLRPLYICLEKVIKDGETFRTVFSQLNFVQIAFEEALAKGPLYFERLIFHVASHLTEDHLSYYRKLNDEKLKNVYLEALAEPVLIDFLATHPNEKGLRQSTLRAEAALRKKIDSVITSDRTEIEHIVPLEKGRIKKVYASAHHVAPSLDKALHFKELPTHPLMEYAIYRLSERLFGYMSPPTELVRLVLEGKPTPVLISKTVVGDNLRDITAASFDRSHWTKLLLLSILTRPGDGRLSNYIVDRQGRIICIDNDMAFVEPVTELKGTFKNSYKVNFHVTPFCLPLQLDSEVLKDFCRLNINAIVEGWIEDLEQKERKYLSLFDVKQSSKDFTPTVLFSKGAFATLLLQFWQLKMFIEAAPDIQKITPLDLLKTLIRLDPTSHQIIHIGGYVEEAYRDQAVTLLSQHLRGIHSREPVPSMTSENYQKACFGKLLTAEDIERRFTLAEARAEFNQTKESSFDFVLTKMEKGHAISKDFEKLDVKKQARALSSMVQHVQLTGYETVQIALLSCTILKNQGLEPFLHRELRRLDLRGSKEVGGSLIDALNSCPKLEELHLSHTTINQITTFFRTRISFLALELLSITHSDSLTSIKLNAPRLKTIKLSHNSLLEGVDFATEFLVDANFIDSPKVILSSDAKVALVKAAQKDQTVISRAPQQFQHDFRALLKAIRKDGLALQYADPELKKSETIVLAAIQRHGYALQFADPELKKKEAIVLAAVQQSGSALEYADPVLKKNEKLVLAAVQQNWRALKYADPVLKKNEKLVLAAVQQNWRALKYADPELKKKETIVLAAIKQNWHSLKYADPELKKNVKFFLDILQQYGPAFQYADPDLKKNEPFVLAAVRQNGDALEYADPVLKKNEKIVLAAVQQYGPALQYADPELKKSEKFVLAVVQQYGPAFEYADPELKKSEKFVLAVVQQYGPAFEYADPELKKNVSIVLAAVQQCGSALEYADPELKKNVTIVLAAVEQDGPALKYADPELKKNETIVLAAVKQNGPSLKYADPELKKNKTIVLAAVKQDKFALLHAAPELKADKEFMAKVAQIKAKSKDQ